MALDISILSPHSNDHVPKSFSVSGSYDIADDTFKDGPKITVTVSKTPPSQATSNEETRSWSASFNEVDPGPHTIVATIELGEEKAEHEITNVIVDRAATPVVGLVEKAGGPQLKSVDPDLQKTVPASADLTAMQSAVISIDAGASQAAPTDVHITYDPQRVKYLLVAIICRMGGGKRRRNNVDVSAGHDVMTSAVHFTAGAQPGTRLRWPEEGRFYVHAIALDQNNQRVGSAVLPMKATKGGK